MILTQPLAHTPRTVASARRSNLGSSHPPPRSASPRKSGITGTARRSGAVDVLANNQLQQELQEDVRDRASETQLSTTPRQHINPRALSARPATTAKRFSPDRTPLRNRILNQRTAKSAAIGRVSDVHSLLSEVLPTELPEETPSRLQIEPVQQEQDDTIQDIENSIGVDIMGNDADPEEPSIAETTQRHLSPDSEIEPELPDPPLVQHDNSDDDQTFEPPSRTNNRRTVPNKANSRRKRKSDAIEDAETAAAATSSPAAKRAKRRANDSDLAESPQQAPKQKKNPRNKSQSQEKPTSSGAGRKALAKKDTNTKLSSQRQAELDDVVEKIKARPSAPRSLYILKRETPADDTVTHTRSGRISVKPLAYWRNERCIYSGTPGRYSTGIDDGAIFPMNSIKEIVRTENLPETTRSQGRKSKSRRKGMGKSRVKGRTDGEEDDSELDLTSNNGHTDPDADDWELDSGTLNGPVASWDATHQIGVPDEPTNVEIAHAHAAIQTKDVKTDTFKYAKLLNTRFFGAGVVDLPAGGRKSAKNSRKMQMCFFVVQGRVTVQVGIQDGQDGDDAEWGTRFSIGKGGFWQVPRGK